MIGLLLVNDGETAVLFDRDVGISGGAAVGIDPGDTPDRLTALVDDRVVDFAGERVPLNGSYYFNKERFDKEFLITSFNMYQLYIYIKRAPLYFPFIEKELVKASIPDDFKYVAVAESGLRNNALSHMAAA